MPKNLGTVVAVVAVVGLLFWLFCSFLVGIGILSWPGAIVAGLVVLGLIAAGGLAGK